MRYIVDVDGRVVDLKLAQTENDEIKKGFFAIVDKVSKVFIPKPQESSGKKESDV